jgi:hypothetical protein
VASDAQGPQLGEAALPDRTSAVGECLQVRVVKHDRDAVSAESHIQLDRVRSEPLRRRKASSLFSAASAVTPPWATICNGTP